jgi:hypothetical protein
MSALAVVMTALSIVNYKNRVLHVCSQVALAMYWTWSLVILAAVLARA